MPENISTPLDSDTVVTWIHFQYEFSAGCSSATGTYSSAPVTNISSVTGVSTKTPMDRSRLRSLMTRKVPTTAAEIAEVNSYMLPSGSRSAARPRVTIETTWATKPSDGHQRARRGRTARPTG